MRTPPSDRITRLWRRTGLAALSLLTTAWLAEPAPARADAEPFLGQIAIVSGTSCPRNWAPANGQILQISTFSALFSLLGTTFGGDGVRTFALPDLRGRASVGLGQGPGLPPNVVGERSGLESFAVTLGAGAGPERAQSAVGPALRATVPILPPELGITHCIALAGSFPSRP